MAAAEFVEASSLAEALRGAAGGAGCDVVGASAATDSASGGAAACGADSAFGNAAAACQGGSGARPFRGWEASGFRMARASSDAVAAFHGLVACQILEVAFRIEGAAASPGPSSVVVADFVVDCTHGVSMDHQASSLHPGEEHAQSFVF